MRKKSIKTVVTRWGSRPVNVTGYYPEQGPFEGYYDKRGDFYSGLPFPSFRFATPSERFASNEDIEQFLAAH